MKPFDPAYLPYLRPARRPLVGVLAGGLLVGLLTIAQGFALGTLLVRLVQVSGTQVSGDWQTPAWWFAGLILARAVLGYLVDVSAVRAALLVSLSLRRRLLGATLDNAGSSPARLGEVTLLATRGMAALEPYFTRYLPALVFAAVLPGLTVIAITWLDWLSGLIVLLTIPLVPVFAALIGMATQARSDRQWHTLAQLSGHFMDVVQGLPTLVAYRRAEAQSRSIRSITDRYRAATMETLKLAFASAAALELIATISVALVAVSVGVRLANGTIEFPTAMIVLLLAPEAYWPLRRVGAEFHSAAEGVSALQQTVSLLENAGPDMIEATSPTEAISPTEALDADHASAFALPGATLRIEDLSLTYDGRAEPVISELDATIQARGITAIVGPSGVGKSTLLAALLGEIPAHTGRISLSPATGETAVTLNPPPAGSEAELLAAWRSQIAWAPQRPWLIEETIRANLLLGDPSAVDTRLWEVLAEVELDDVVKALPDGLNTRLGEHGAGLSAGQRARLGLARVLVSERPWVVLDEPTAHLDAATERVIVRVLQRLAETRGVIVVAHRPEIVAVADQVIALSAPVATEPGTAAADEPAAASVQRPVESRRRTPDATLEPSRPRRGWRQLGTLLGTGSVASGVALTATASWLITRAADRPQILTLMVAIVSVRMFGLARPALRYAERLVSHDAALRLLAERRAEVYDALVPLVPGRLGRNRGDLLTSVVDDVDSLVDRQLRVRQPLLTSLGVGVLAVILTGLASLPAGVITVAGLLIAVVCGTLVRSVASRTETRFVRARASLSAAVSAMVRDARQLAVWGAAETALAAVDDAARQQNAAASRTISAQAGARAVLLVAGGAGVLASALWVPSSTLGPALLALVVMLPIALVDAYLPISDAAALSVRTERAGARIDSLVTASPLVSDPDSPLPPPARPLTEDWVSLSAGWGKNPAFADLELRLSPGSRLGVVGPSGSGKSTLAAVLLRFLDPQHGSVRLDGIDLRDLSLDDVRRATGLVDDDPHIFGSTVRENLRLANPGADDDRLLEALAATHLQDWFAQLPSGLDTFLGDGGQAVSGGERARLGMARAVLADQPILVLDEPTAHLDHGTAARVAEEFLGAPGRGGDDRTIVWITHGTVGLDHLDRVLNLSDHAAPEAAESEVRPSSDQAVDLTLR